MIRKYIHSSVWLLILFFSVISIGQNRKEQKGDRKFETYAYIEAIRVYERMAQKGYVNTSILCKLGDSYYFNGKLREAHKWYNKLFEGNYEDKDLLLLDSEYYFRYAQTLKAIDQVEKSNEIFGKFAELETIDSRVRLFLLSEDIEKETLAAPSYDMRKLDINTKSSDYGATLLGSQLVFSSARESNQLKNSGIHSWTNEPYTQLYGSIILEEGVFDQPELFSKELASRDLNMSTAVFTKEGNTIYFTSNSSSFKRRKKAKFNKEEKAVLKIYRAHKKKDGTWGNIEELPFNLQDYNTAHPALTPDEKWLYFVSDRQRSLGQSDLFRVGIYDSNSFGPVEHLGEKVNTAGRESFPFISSDNMLYFSSDGRPGFGGLDLYKVKINIDGTFGSVLNLGPDINSPTDDFGIYIDERTKKGFFTTNRVASQGDDIYLFKEKPCIQILDGNVYDKDSGQGIGEVEFIIYDRSQQEIERIKADEFGYYSINSMRCGLRYRVRVSKEGFITQEFVVDTDRLVKQRMNILLESGTISVGEGDDLFHKLNLSPIYFDFDKSDIRADAMIELMKIVEVMLQHPNLRIDIRSHTDSRGNDKYNLKLSERRSQSTRQWMIEKGIEANRLTAKGYGESQLLNDCANDVHCSDLEHQINRRSEFIIMGLE